MGVFNMTMAVVVDTSEVVCDNRGLVNFISLNISRLAQIGFPKKKTFLRPTVSGYVAMCYDLPTTKESLINSHQQGSECKVPLNGIRN